MKCPECNAEMFIDEWNGWVWLCVCGNVEFATDEEIEEEETK